MEGTLFEQHGATRSPIGTKMEPGKLIFERQKDGNWHGKWIVANRFTMGVVGWTNPVITGTAGSN